MVSMSNHTHAQTAVRVGPADSSVSVLNPSGIVLAREIGQIHIEQLLHSQIGHLGQL
jgi:hypothetical protein